MIRPTLAPNFIGRNCAGWWLLLIAMIVTIAVYITGFSGGYLFDDYPNIVDNQGVQPRDTSASELMYAALSSPSSEFKRPLASLSFAANYLATGLDPFWMKLTNLVIHLLNGWLMFLLARALLLSVGLAPSASSYGGEGEAKRRPARDLLSVVPRGLPLVMGATVGATSVAVPSANALSAGAAAESIVAEAAPTTGESPSGVSAGSSRETAGQRNRAGVVAALIAAGWMLLPINLTGVLYVVQRMESMANLFVLLGLIGYVAGRRRMLGWAGAPRPYDSQPTPRRFSADTRNFMLCLISITVSTAVGILAKETAVVLPLYALLIEWMLFHFTTPTGTRDRRVVVLFMLVLVLPMTLGVAWLLPGILRPETWATRDFTLGTRLLSETRIVMDYIYWTLLPTPDALSFYHDDFRISTGVLTPWTTLLSIVLLGGLIALMLWTRRRQPLAALGIALFLGCQLLTGTIIPLELIYEHRNYFASFGLMLAVVPLLAVPRSASLARPRHVLLAGLMLSWTALTAMTAYAWGNPLRLAEDLAIRAPQSPRAQYELGRTYIIYSHYDPTSPFTRLAYAPLEKAAALPGSSILPEQALIFMNARMQRPLKDAWWNSMVAKLKAHKPGIQDESSLGALTQCAREHHCDLPQDRMMESFMAALAHPDPSARLLATYGDYAWNVMDDHALGLRVTEEAVKAQPDEPAYRITLVRMLAAQGRKTDAGRAIKQLETMNIGGRLNHSLSELHALSGLK